MAKDGRQIESITFGWRDSPQAEEHIYAVLAGDIEDMGPFSPRIHSSEHHICHLCR